jgi:hypothetical protein
MIAATPRNPSSATKFRSVNEAVAVCAAEISKFTIPQLIADIHWRILPAQLKCRHQAGFSIAR